MNDIIDDSIQFDGTGQSTNPLPAVSGSENLEVEVKFFINHMSGWRRRLVDGGAKIVAPRVYERNIRFDTPEEMLLAKGQLLRLRQDSRIRLTFKGPAAEDAHSEAKVREEIEVTVDDIDQMTIILQRLGFAPVQVYEKYRETFHWRDVEIVLDETPFGVFIELEGSETAIRAAAAELGLDWSRRVLANYLALMALARRTFNLPFTDLTFANFENHPVSMARLLPVSHLSA